MPESSHDAWFEGKEFTADWVSNKLDLWTPVLREIEDKADILEVGSYEGRSAIAFLEMLTNSKITCVDIFKDPEVEGRFDRNMAPYGARVTKHKGLAIRTMESLFRSNRAYDLIYLDAAKERTGAFVVSALGWHLCRVGGVIIWDDLSWKPRRDPAKRPEPGSRLFINTFASCRPLSSTRTSASRERSRLGPRSRSSQPPEAFAERASSDRPARGLAIAGASG